MAFICLSEIHQAGGYSFLGDPAGCLVVDGLVGAMDGDLIHDQKTGTQSINKMG